MLRRTLLFLFSVLCIAAAHADTIEVRGQITLVAGNMPPMIYVHPFSGDGTDVSSIVTNGTFVLHVPISAPMPYNLRLPRSSYDIMLSPKEKVVNLTISLNNDQMTQLKIEGSNENDAYNSFAPAVNLYDTKLQKLFVKCEKEEDCQKDLSEILTDYKAELITIQEKYKGTYTADVLCKMKIPMISQDIKNTSAEYRKGYWANVPFSDPVILTNPVYGKMIENYVDYLIEPKLSKEEAFIKDLMGKAGADPKVLSKTAAVLYDALFYKSREKMLGMFISWYNDNKAAVNNPVIDVKVKNLSKVMPGQPFLDVVRKDMTGNDKSLKDVVSKSSLTLLLFWSSDCSHCREEMPLIKEMYIKYHDKGLDIYAASLEQDMDKWKTYIKENNLSWTNVKNMQDGGGTNPSMDYVVMSTPTLVMIDKKGTIVHRFVPKNKLEKYIQEVLK